MNLSRVNANEYRMGKTYRLSRFNGWWFVGNVHGAYYAAFGTLPAARKFVLDRFGD